MRTISFVIPCYNSEKFISNTINDIQEVINNKLKDNKTEIILINDSSKDNTYKKIEEIAKNYKNIKYIDLARNFGQHSAIMAGLNKANGDIIICLDDDGQTPAYEIPRLIGALNDDVDVVYAKYKQKKHTFFRNFGSKINDFMLGIMLGKPKDLYISSFFAIKKYVKDEITKYRNPYPYLGGLILRTTNRIINIETDHLERSEGSSGYTIKRLLKLYLNGLTNFSVKPLRMSLFFSIIFIACAFIISIYLIINKVLNPNIPIGWTSTMLIILLVGAVITFLLGLIGEYLGRIYISINNIPQYVERKNIDEKN